MMECSRKSCRLLQNRFQMLKGCKHLADIVFILNPHSLEIPAHKLVLSLASPRFSREFSDHNGYEKKVYPMVNMDPHLFDAFLTFIYTADVTLCPEIAFGLIKLAEMYEIDELRCICEDYVHKTLNECNIWTYFGQSVDMVGGHLRLKCLDFISNSNGGIFNQPNFLMVSRDGIKLLLEMESIRVTESELLEVIIKWIDSHAVSSGRREQLGELVHLIHFPTMSTMEFNHLVHKYPDILTDDEVREISQAISGSTTGTCTFPREPRMHLPKVLSSGTSSLRIVYQFTHISGSLEKIHDLMVTFKIVSVRDAFVSGIGILVDQSFQQAIHGEICVQVNTNNEWKNESFPAIEGGHQMPYGQKHKLLFLVFQETLQILPQHWYRINLTTNCDHVVRVDGEFCETVSLSQEEHVKFIRNHGSSSICIPLILFK